MKRLVPVLLAGIALLGLNATPVLAQASGTVDIDISFPPLIILYYYSDITVTIPSAALLNLMTGGDDDIETTGGTVDVSASGGILEGTLAGPGTDLDVNPADVNLHLNTIWAVRSVGAASGNNTQVVVSAPENATLTGSNGGTIVVDDTDIRKNGGTFDGNRQDDFPPTGLGSYQLGDVLLELDISSASTEGTYSNATGGQFTITASSL